MPVSTRKPVSASVALSSATSRSWRRSRSADEAVGDGQPRRVVGEHQVLVAELARGLDHLLERRAAVGGVGVAVAVAAQRAAAGRGGVGELAALGGLQPAQVVRLLAGERLGDAAGRHVADAAQPTQLAGQGERRQLVAVAAAQGRGGRGSRTR